MPTVPAPIGPGAPFELLVETPASGTGLPDGFRAVYGGDWVVPDTNERPYRYSGFVASHDGRVSFNVHGHEGGGDISGFDAHDQWLLGLLRARADAVIVGANTLRTEAGHLWTSEYIAPADEPAFAALRAAEGRAPHPLQVFLTRSGDLPRDAAVFDDHRLAVIVATTARGRAVLAERLGPDTRVTLLVVGDRRRRRRPGASRPHRGCTAPPGRPRTRPPAEPAAPRRPPVPTHRLPPRRLNPATRLRSRSR